MFSKWSGYHENCKLNILFHEGVTGHAQCVQKYQIFNISGSFSNCSNESWSFQSVTQSAIQSFSQSVNQSVSCLSFYCGVSLMCQLPFFFYCQVSLILWLLCNWLKIAGLIKFWLSRYRPKCSRLFILWDYLKRSHFFYRNERIKFCQLQSY